MADFPADARAILGFAASTGGANEKHEVDNIRITLFDNPRQLVPVDEDLGDLATCGGLNAGGPEMVATIDGTAFQFLADRQFGAFVVDLLSDPQSIILITNVAGFTSGANVGGDATTPVQNLNDPSLEAIYQTNRWSDGPVGYNVKVPPGRYQVHVLLNSDRPQQILGGGATGSGATQFFNVALEGSAVLKWFSPALAAGAELGGPAAVQDAAVLRTYELDVTDGLLNVRVTDNGGGTPPENAAINGFTWCRIGDATGEPVTGQIEDNFPLPFAASPQQCFTAEFTGPDFTAPPGMQVNVGGGSFTPQLFNNKLQVIDDTVGSSAVSAFFTNQTVDLTTNRLSFSFEIDMESQGSTADGVVFTVLGGNDPNRVGGGGGAMGFAGIGSPSIGVEFDLWDGSPGDDSGFNTNGYGHTAVVANSSVSHIVDTQDTFPLLVPPDKWLDMLGSTIRVQGEINNGYVRVYAEQDGFPRRLILDSFVPAALAITDGHVGFTGGTGGATATVDIDNVRICLGGDPDEFCAQDPPPDPCWNCPTLTQALSTGAGYDPNDPATQGFNCPPVELMLVPSEVSVLVDRSQQVRLVGTIDAQGGLEDGVTRTVDAYTSNNPSVATVDADGVITGVRGGTTVVNAIVGGQVVASANVAVIGAGGTATIMVRVAAGNDDAEEHITEGNNIDLGSSDLELGAEGGGGDLQHIGIRFLNLDIPQGAQIESASVQFTVDETDDEQTSLRIFGELVPNAAQFSSALFDISSRTRTAASVDWNDIPVWDTVGVAGPDQQTPDLSSLIQEIVNQEDWAPGNALAILIEPNPGGERTAESFNGSQDAAPLLTVTFVVPGPGNCILHFEAEDFTSQVSNDGVHNWEVVEGGNYANADAGRHIESLPEANVNNNAGNVFTDGGAVARYSFTVNEAADYHIWVRCAAVDGGSDSFYLRIAELGGAGGNAGDWWRFNPPVTNGDFTDAWQGQGGLGNQRGGGVDNARAMIESLEPGTYTLELAMREDGSGVDAFIIDPIGAFDGTDASAGVIPIRNEQPPSCSLDVAGPAPVFTSIMGGLGAAADEFISPLGEDVPFTQFGLTTDIVLDSITVAGSAYTAGGAAPTVVSFVSNGDGTHVVTLDSAVAPGHWLRLDLELAGAGTASAAVSVWIAHQPLDVNQDGQTNIRDATAFGDVFRGTGEPRLININGDGSVNVRDATAFGNNWNGVPPLQAWRNTNLPARP